MTTTLAISVGVVLGAGFLYAVSRLGTVIEPYTLTSETDESWLEGDYPDAGAGTDDGGYASSVKAGYVEDPDAWADRIARRIAADPDAAYKAIQAERQRLNAREGDPQ